MPSRSSQSSTRGSATVPEKRPSANASVPAHTRTPTFGMQRKTGTSSSTMVSSVVVETPAATESTDRSGVISPETSRRTRSTSIGLTAMTMISERSTSSRFVAATETPRDSASRLARPEPRSLTMMREARSGSARTHPSIIAEAMLPAPIRPRTLSRCTRRMVRGSQHTRRESIHRNLLRMWDTTAVNVTHAVRGIP